MDPTMRYTIALVCSMSLLSCEKSERKDSAEHLNPQARAYLDRMDKKEAANREKGWKHVEGSGYHYKRPTGWVESKDIDKGDYFIITSPENDTLIKLTSRYIESIPENVSNLTDWAKFQYSEMGMPEALLATTVLDVTHGEALEARVNIGHQYMRARYFTDIFTNPQSQRFWILMVIADRQAETETPEVQAFLDTFRIENFNWIQPETE